MNDQRLQMFNESTILLNSKHHCYCVVIAQTIDSTCVKTIYPLVTNNLTIVSPNYLLFIYMVQSVLSIKINSRPYLQLLCAESPATKVPTTLFRDISHPALFYNLEHRTLL